MPANARAELGHDWMSGPGFDAREIEGLDKRRPPFEFDSSDLQERNASPRIEGLPILAWWTRGHQSLTLACMHASPWLRNRG